MLPNQFERQSRKFDVRKQTLSFQGSKRANPLKSNLTRRNIRSFQCNPATRVLVNQCRTSSTKQQVFLYLNKVFYGLKNTNGLSFD